MRMLTGRKSSGQMFLLLYGKREVWHAVSFIKQAAAAGDDVEDIAFIQHREIRRAFFFLAVCGNDASVGRARRPVLLALGAASRPGKLTNRLDFKRCVHLLCAFGIIVVWDHCSSRLMRHFAKPSQVLWVPVAAYYCVLFSPRGTSGGILDHLLRLRAGQAPPRQ